MNLTIIRPTGKKTITISWLEVETDVGNFVIQKGHTPMILALLKEKPIKALLGNGKQENIEAPYGGILEVQRDAVNLLLDE